MVNERRKGFKAVADRIGGQGDGARSEEGHHGRSSNCEAAILCFSIYDADRPAFLIEQWRTRIPRLDLRRALNHASALTGPDAAAHNAESNGRALGPWPLHRIAESSNMLPYWDITSNLESCRDRLQRLQERKINAGLGSDHLSSRGHLRVLEPGVLTVRQDMSVRDRVPGSENEERSPYVGGIRLLGLGRWRSKERRAGHTGEARKRTRQRCTEACTLQATG